MSIGALFGGGGGDSGGGNSWAGPIGTIATGVWNREESNRNRDWQQNMSDTAHEREVGDLKRAGLNPILSALGKGASVPGGSQSSMSDLGASVNTGQATAAAVKLTHKDIQKREDEMVNLASDSAKKVEEKRLAREQVEEQKIKNRIADQTSAAAIKHGNATGNYAEAREVMGLINSGASSAGAILGLPKEIIKGLKTFSPKK